MQVCLRMMLSIPSLNLSPPQSPYHQINSGESQNVRDLYLRLTRLDISSPPQRICLQLSRFVWS